MTGGAGRLGSALKAVAGERGAPIHALPHAACDITRPDEIEAMLESIRPEVVINAAARTAVDRCEGEKDLTFRVNADGAEAVARACARHAVHCIHVSTDYVFGDEGATPRTEESPLAPVNVYGASKARAEAKVIAAHPDARIVRLAWLFGDRADDFIGRLLEIGARRDVIEVVDDQIGSPTPIVDAAKALLDIAEHVVNGAAVPPILHVAGAPATTRCEWARVTFAAAAKLGGPAPSVRPVPTSAFPTPARRPLYTALDTSAFERLIGPSPLWKNATEASVRRRLMTADARP